jgi:hypothetical protein
VPGSISPVEGYRNTLYKGATLNPQEAICVRI